MTKLLLYYLLAINVITLVVYIADKIKAKRHMWRIPESTLLSLAIIGGSISAPIDIFVIRHKSQHPKFRIGVPIIFILQLTVAYWILWRL